MFVQVGDQVYIEKNIQKACHDTGRSTKRRELESYRSEQPYDHILSSPLKRPPTNSAGRRLLEASSGDAARIMVQEIIDITYLPHKAVAEVSKDKEPIGRECAGFNWFESQLMSDSNELRVK